MNRTMAVETWREVCGSDMVMASLPPTGRMLEEFAARIEAAEREACAKTCEALNANAPEFQRPNGVECARAIRKRSNVKWNTYLSKNIPTYS